MRIHFTVEDLARTRVGTALGPLAETLMAVSSLRSTCQPPARLNGWREQAGRQHTAEMKPLVALFPGAIGVDLWTLTGYAPTIEQGIEALLRVPRDHLLAELDGLDRLWPTCRLPRSAWAIADPGSDARLRLADAALATYRALVEPYWARMHMRLHAEQVYRGQILAHGGVGQLLATLCVSNIRWNPPVLELLSHGNGVNNFDMYLGGRGICLVPSLLIGDYSILMTDMRDPNAQPRLLYPVSAGLTAGTRLWAAAPPDGGALAALVGRTRAAVMSGIAGGSSTTDIARRAGISLAAASQHATVLRDAGLITTHRHGRAVLHTLTPLGTELLGAARPPGGPEPDHGVRLSLPST